MECGCYDFGPFLCTEDVVLDMGFAVPDNGTFDGEVMVTSTNHRFRLPWLIETGVDLEIPQSLLNEDNVYTFQVFDGFGNRITMITDQGEEDEKEWSCFTFQTVIAHVRT